MPIRSPNGFRGAAGVPRGCYPRGNGSPMAIAMRALCALLAVDACACQPTVVVATRVCADPPNDAGATVDPDAAVTLPWSTGFEDGFCDYGAPMGFCFATGIGSYSLVTSPVHSGRYAAEFTIESDFDAGSQVRCVEQGVFPKLAYYGAWYFVPSPAPANTGNWNLLHYQGGPPGGHLNYLWDVSLNGGGGGPLHAFLRQYGVDGGEAVAASAAPAVPLDQWFHLEVFFNRAKDATGELSLSQDGVDAGRITGVATDLSDWGQWYVGNLANALAPPLSKVYVDDVTIQSMP